MVTSLSNTESVDTRHWSSVREAGTLFGLRFLWLVHKLLGRKAVSILLIPTVAYFLVFRSKARRSSLDYLKTHYQYFPNAWTRKPGLRDVARHFREFAETVVDKLLSWLIHIDAEDFDVEDLRYVEAQLANPEGQLIIGSHFGNLEYCRGFMHRYNHKVINILVHDKHSENYNTIMQQLNSESRLNIFQVEEFDIPTMLKLKNKIDDGEWIFIAGDRTPPSGNERTVTVDFMGRKAALPIGPYMLAKGLDCPVQLVFASYDYSQPELPVRFKLSHFAERIELRRPHREQQLLDYAQAYAKELERHCQQAPFQWFNFYDYWLDDNKEVAA
ncbi:MAG: hypothetical protein KTR16_16545 [Acidiferrobacterales bacterium]|nr:hypothetical protein [Acidiferrobacterales bacterium]